MNAQLESAYQVSLDIETLGVTQNSVVIQIGAVAFKLRDDYPAFETIKKFEMNVDIREQISRYRYIDPATARWHLLRNTENFLEALTGYVDPAVMISNLTDWLESFEPFPYIWTFGPAFDIAIIDNLCLHLDVESPWGKDRRYRKLLDLRTLNIFMNRPRVETPPESKHHALCDAYYQGKEIHTAYQYTLCVEA